MSKKTKCIFKDKYHKWISDCEDYKYWGEIDEEVEIVATIEQREKETN